MRKSEEVLKEVIDWAEKNDDVRAVLLTGSRASPENITDALSDYDIELAVNNATYYLTSEDWLSVFGNVLAIIREDELSLRLVLFEDFRIDFRIHSLIDFPSYINQVELPRHLNAGFTVLLDKDKITANAQLPNYKFFVVNRPTQKQFSKTVTDFLWDTTYVAKCLWRNELFYAKNMSDNIIRFSYTEKIVEWYLGVQNKWEISPGKHGRFFKRLLDAEIWLELESTFAGSGLKENWISLFATLKLFRRLAKAVAENLDYPYPEALDLKITGYLEKIRSLDKGSAYLQ